MNKASEVIYIERMLKFEGNNVAVIFGTNQNGNLIRATLSSNSNYIPNPGDTCLINGQWVNHVKYGKQFSANDIQLQSIRNNSALRHFLLYNHNFRGIGFGKAKIDDLLCEFGNKLPKLADNNDIDTLKKAKKLSTNVLVKFLSAWQGASAHCETTLYLNQYGINAKTSNLIMKIWPTNTVATLKSNPYLLIELCNWNIIDHVAQTIGFSRNDPLRLCALARSSVYKSLDNYGHTLVPHNDLLNLIKMGKKLGNTAIQLAHDQNYITGSESKGWQSYSIKKMEDFVRSEIYQTLTTINHAGYTLVDGTYASESLIHLYIDRYVDEKRISTSGFLLTLEQRQAVINACIEQISIINGGAGTGKTTILECINYVISKFYGVIHQLAISGRAAQCIRESTDKLANTFTTFFNRLKSHDTDLHLSKNPLIIIDESSMVDLSQAFTLLRYLKTYNYRLLLVGDTRQLPPIGFGLFFSVLINSKSIPKTTLKQIHRLRDESGIPTISDQIINNIPPKLPEFSNQTSGVSFIQCTEDILIKQLNTAIDTLTLLGEVQILAMKSKTVKSINNHMQTKYTIGNGGYGKKEHFGFGKTFNIDDPIIHTVNDYGRCLWNGSLGYVSNIKRSDSEITITCNFDGIDYDFLPHELENLELAWAIAVHKSQGSSFERVIIPIFPHKPMDNAMIYTALTRARKQVIFIGDLRSFQNAISRPSNSELRNVGLTID